jgi:phosphoribosylformimino-5-aminoimidazole carboxamide ribotide isomerase
MQVLPAVDLLNGRVVRLAEGKFENVTIYADDPGILLDDWAELGIDRVHLVDLNAARGDGHNQNWVQRIAKEGKVKLQVGGGMRDIDTVRSMFDIGVDRVVVGTSALLDADFLAVLAQMFSPEKVVVGLDVRDRKLMVQGWTATVEETMEAFVLRAMGLGFRQFLCTDVSRDGMLQGPAIKLYEELIYHYPHIQVIASGGVRDEDDLRRLRKSKLHAAVVGRAIYEGTLEIEDIVDFNRK